jgi:hypothetical protein
MYWSSTKAPVHLFKRAYESPEVAAHLRENAFIDPSILAAELGLKALCAESVKAYQRRLGVRSITGYEAKR